MFNQILQHIQRTSSRVPSPVCLIDGLLDQIETLSRAILPASADNPSHRNADDRSAPRPVRVVARSTGHST